MVARGNCSHNSGLRLFLPFSLAIHYPWRGFTLMSAWHASTRVLECDFWVKKKNACWRLSESEKEKIDNISDIIYSYDE
jgi:hypothetical protein